MHGKCRFALPMLGGQRVGWGEFRPQGFMWARALRRFMHRNLLGSSCCLGEAGVEVVGRVIGDDFLGAGR